MTMRNFIENGKVANLHHIGDATTNAELFVNMRNYQGAFFFAENGSGSSIIIGLQQAKNVLGNARKALALTNIYICDFADANEPDQDLWSEVEVDANTYTLLDGNGVIIPIRPGMFDVEGDFDCISVDRVPFSANTSAKLFLHDGPMGITGSVLHIPSARVDNQSDADD